MTLSFEVFQRADRRWTAECSNGLRVVAKNEVVAWYGLQRLLAMTKESWDEEECPHSPVPQL